MSDWELLALLRTFENTIARLKVKIAELEEELHKAKIKQLGRLDPEKVTREFDTLKKENTRLKEQVRVRGERMEYIIKWLKYHYPNAYPAGWDDWFDNGKVRDERN